MHFGNRRVNEIDQNPPQEPHMLVAPVPRVRPFEIRAFLFLLNPRGRALWFISAGREFMAAVPLIVFPCCLQKFFFINGDPGTSFRLRPVSSASRTIGRRGSRSRALIGRDAGHVTARFRHAFFGRDRYMIGSKSAICSCSCSLKCFVLPFLFAHFFLLSELLQI